MPNNKHISTQPTGYQVRIVRSGKTTNRWFSNIQWGGQRKALNAAKQWRDQQLVVLPSSAVSKMTAPASKANVSTSIRGVSRYIHHDSRRDKDILRYQVYYQITKGEPRVKTFEVGNIEHLSADEDFHARRTAVQFRLDYMNARAQGRTIDPGQYNNWKHRRIYEEKVSL